VIGRDATACKALEINALWYNALRLTEKWLLETDRPDAADSVAKHARTAYASFQNRFWYEKGGYLYDIEDGETGDDCSLRPNQLLAISLEYPILDREKWLPVVKVVKEKLLAPSVCARLPPEKKITNRNMTETCECLAEGLPRRIVSGKSIPRCI